MSPAILVTMLDATTDQLNAISHMFPASVAPAVSVFLFLSIGAVALFTFLSIASWAGTRQAERAAYYKAEMMKKIAEAGGERNHALEYLREQERIDAAKRLGSIKLGGLINIGIGLGLAALLMGLVHGTPVYLVGTIPIFIGLALLAYGHWFAPERPVPAQSPMTTSQG